MTTTPEQFKSYLHAPEGTQLEFKSATGGFHFDELVKYCVALANEGGGKFLLGISDKRPRLVLGTQAFQEPGRTEAGLFERLHRRVPVEEYLHEGKRLLIVHVPSRNPGEAWQDDGRFWMRAGDAVVPMSSDQLRLIHAEGEPDFCAQIRSAAKPGDLDPKALAEFRARWAKKSGNPRMLNWSNEQTLADAELMAEGKLTQQQPRNRRLAEAFAKCGLVERAGQGMNLIYEQAILHSKPLPDFTGTTARQVRLALHGNITNPAFIRFLEKVGQERLSAFSTFDLLVLDHLQRGHPVPPTLRSRLPALVEAGIVETIGRGRGTRHFLSRKFHVETGQAGAYTRKKGLDCETNKALLLRHIEDSGTNGSPISDLEQVLPACSRRQVQRLLGELKRDGKVNLTGSTNQLRWQIK
jgi:predicted HTH transcriptional regulator